MAKGKPKAQVKSKADERPERGSPWAINPFEKVFSLSPVMLAYLDRDFNFIAVNDAYAAAARKPKEFFPGKNHFSLYPHEENEAIFRQVVDTGEQFYISAKPFQHPDQPERGTTYWDWSLVPVKDAGGKVEGLVFSLIDVTDRKRAEEALDKYQAHLEEMVEARTAALMETNVHLEQEIAERRKSEEERKKVQDQLRQSQKMEALGLLAGGIAHDFNNRLAAIINFCHLAKIKLPEQSPAGKYLNQILLASKSAANLAHGLLAFSRKEVLNPGPVNLNMLITNFRDFLVRIIGEGIELDFETSRKDLTVMADRGQLENVLLNLSINARDAMPGGGRLSISARSAAIDRGFIKLHGYGRPGAYAVITVTDTGTGMDEATRQRIFEPFFTTKESGKGTGLGLSIVYGIVKQHDGHITCYSEPGKGTTFRVYLPLAPAALKKEEILAPLLPFAASGETVLLAEDDPGVREGIKALLEETGYRVIEAENGEDAVKKFSERTVEIALVILDVIMPRLNGRGAYEKISRLKPGINVLFMTGYSGDHIRQDLLDEGAYYVNKPVMPLEFLKKIRELLASS